ncbi:MAG TPA: protein translocase subunit SecDF [Desulfobulbaceae bacterium]|nr:MAG: preprotein translocase subunit SecF [Deltaproteobacteria bacterium RIFOXYD12_FULL_53_23]HCC55285.1 protein translocase subunit SecDF [Desulfobulbaceae bacterium]
MSSSLRWKIILLLFITIFAGLTVAPSFTRVPVWWQKYLAPAGLKLGLDLQGGMHLVLKVDLKKAIENNLDFSAQDLKEALAEKKITVVRTASGDTRKIILTLPNSGALETVKQIISKDFPDLDSEFQTDQGSFPRIILSLKQAKIDFINNKAVDQSLEILRNRVDQFGVAEPAIVRQGADEIVIQLPGVKDAQRALNLIGRTAQLEFKLVDNTPGLNLPQLIAQAIQSGQWQEGGSRKQLNIALQNTLPTGTEIYFEKDIDKTTKKESKLPILLKSQVLMTGDMVKGAQVGVGGNFNEPYVSLDFTGRGGVVFGQVTEKNVGKRFAIVLDEVVRSSPVIREKILGGSAQISGSFSYEEATDLAIVLRIGALPAPVEIVQNLTVGASLGQDSINKGLMSGLLGTFLVVVFMAVYYRLSGVVANLAMVLNILLLFAGLAMMGGTLTLPGIAGIILSVGMAVDSNIVIFERMREEFALGKSVRSGVEAGYAKAFWTIIDAHVTTLITALALFLFGTGPIKGFAATLSLGIIFNLFSTLFASKLFYESMQGKRKLKKLSFMLFLKNPQLDYMRIKNLTFTISGTCALIGCLAFVQIIRGQANMGVDFSGGTLLQYKSSQPFSLGEIRTALAKGELEGVELQKVEGENRLIVKIKNSEKVVGHVSEAVTAQLNTNFPNNRFTVENQSEIGSSVSDTLRSKALLAVIVSLLGVIVYLGLRFDLRFGIAATLATLHDVLAVLGLIWLLNMEVTLLTVTALLTLAGYSLNDTVIIFDRIRENQRKSADPENITDALINTSTNEVLSRSIVTSLTVFLVLTALYTLGGAVIHDFSFALLVGVIVGTYSSVFVASPLLTIWHRGKTA